MSVVMLMREAWELVDTRGGRSRGAKLAKDALKIDSLCVDALTLLAWVESDPARKVRFAEEGLRAGRRRFAKMIAQDPADRSVSAQILLKPYQWSGRIAAETLGKSASYRDRTRAREIADQMLIEFPGDKLEFRHLITLWNALDRKWDEGVELAVDIAVEHYSDGIWWGLLFALQCDLTNAGDYETWAITSNAYVPDLLMAERAPRESKMGAGPFRDPRSREAARAYAAVAHPAWAGADIASKKLPEYCERARKLLVADQAADEDMVS